MSTWIVKDYNDLKEGDGVTFFGVHVLRWNHETMGQPAIGITEEVEENPDVQELVDAAELTLMSLNIFRAEVVRQDMIVPNWVINCLESLAPAIKKARGESNGN